MFGKVTEQFRSIFSKIAGKRSLTEENIKEAVRSVRLALLDADVHYGVVSQFVKQVKEKALGADLLKSVDPGDQFIKLVRDELVDLMGKEEATLSLKGSPATVVVCGLQGSGKTTFCGKLALFLQKKGFAKKVLIVGCDLQRAAALHQLELVAQGAGALFFGEKGVQSALEMATLGLAKGRQEGVDVVIFDTAGRVHVDEEMMKELSDVCQKVKPQELFFVANSALGQEAVSVATEFSRRVPVTGNVLTMLDGTARAGAALSIRESTKKPLVFESFGEHLQELRLFNPESMADRILGFGDVINLVKAAEEQTTEEEQERLEKKLRKASFTYDDYLKQMGMVKKMGSFQSLLKMVPGMDQMPNLDTTEGEFQRVEAIILSMTPEEREEKVELVPQRRWRIAKGSGTKVDDVNRLIKGFKRMKDLLKNKKGNFAWH